MALRTFKYHTLAELKTALKSLGEAVASGNVEILKNSTSGWLTQFGRRTAVEIKDAILEMRTEIYLRGQDDNAKDKAMCEEAEPTDPRREKVMRVEHRHPDSY